MSNRADRYRNSKPPEPRRDENNQQKSDYTDVFWSLSIDEDEWPEYDDEWPDNERIMDRVFLKGGKVKLRRPKPLLFDSIRFAFRGETKRKFSKNSVQFEVDTVDGVTVFSATARFNAHNDPNYYLNRNLLEKTDTLKPSFRSFFLVYDFILLKHSGFKCRF